MDSLNRETANVGGGTDSTSTLGGVNLLDGSHPHDGPLQSLGARQQSVGTNLTVTSVGGGSGVAGGGGGSADIGSNSRDIESSPPPGRGNGAHDNGNLKSMQSNSSSVSELSVACLQDRISQMEESHHCTSEELQATLQELADLQDQVNLLQLENDQLEQDKAVLYESLCSQTEKLEECRAQIIKLRQLLIEQYSSSGPGNTTLTNPFQPLPLDGSSTSVSTATSSSLVPQPTVVSTKALSTKPLSPEDQVESESALLVELHTAQDRISFLESTVESINSEKKDLSSQLNLLEQKLASSRLEIATLRTQLELTHSSIDESDFNNVTKRDKKADGDGENNRLLLGEIRREKQLIESKLAQLEQQNRHAQIEVSKFKEELITARDQLIVARNNSKKTKEDYDYRIATLEEEKMDLLKRINLLEDAAHQSDVICQRHLDEKRELKVSINDLQIKVGHLSEELSKTCRELDETKREQSMEQEEWKSFQNDLLTTVRVANEFKMDAMEQSEKVANRNKILEEKISRLETEIQRLKASHEEKQNSSLDSCSFSSALQNQSLHSSTLDALGIIQASPSPHSSNPPSPMRTPTNFEQQQQQQRAAARQAVAEFMNTPGRPSIARWVEARSCSQMSVKALIDSIESSGPPGSTAGNTPYHAQIAIGSSPCSSTSSLNSIHSPLGNSNPTTSCGSGVGVGGAGGGDLVTFRKPDPMLPHHNPLPKTATRSFSCPAGQSGNKVPVAEVAPSCCAVEGVSKSPSHLHGSSPNPNGANGVSDPLGTPIYGKTLLGHKFDSLRRNSLGDLSEKKDPLMNLIKSGGSKRNALLKWCQNKTIGYRSIDITNFSSSWNDGLAFCALLHTYLPDRIPYDSLDCGDKRRNFSIAFKAAESIGIPTTLNLEELVTQERPDWHQIMAYVTSVYKHFES